MAGLGGAARVAIEKIFISKCKNSYLNFFLFDEWFHLKIRYNRDFCNIFRKRLVKRKYYLTLKCYKSETIHHTTNSCSKKR